MQIEIDKLNCELKKYKQELPKYRNDKNNEQESNDNWYICEVNKSGEYRILGDKFVENNKSKGYLIINGQKTESLEAHANLEEGKNKIIIRFNKPITNFSYMFDGCYQLTDISPLINIDTSNSISFERMFQYCENLVDINSFKYWNVSNSNSFKYMLYYCKKIIDISPL